MIKKILFKKFPKEATLVDQALLSEYTTFGLGGSCPLLVDCPTAEVLLKSAQLLIAESIDFVVIGQGSNLLVADAGIDAVVLRFCAEEPHVEFEADGVRVSGNTLLDDLAQMTVEDGWGDLSFCCGIPGTVGGAIVGNAGAFGRQIGDLVKSVEIMERDGRVHDVAGDRLGFEYRSSALKQTGGVVTQAVLNLQPMDSEPLKEERDRIMTLRRNKHPDWRKDPCAGSVFRNVEPTSSAGRRQAAGWFLDEVGARNFRVGRAHLFEKHANIVVADEGATTREVFELTKKMQAAVQKKFDLTLEREITLLGQF